jgi:hypothetical protein
LLLIGFCGVWFWFGVLLWLLMWFSFLLFLTFLFVGDGGLLDFVLYWCGSSCFVFVGEWDVGPSIFRFYILFVILVFYIFDLQLGDLMIGVVFVGWIDIVSWVIHFLCCAFGSNV